MSFHRSFVLLLLTWVAATGQQPVEKAPAAPEPAPPAAAIPAPTTGGPAATPGAPPALPVPAGVIPPAPGGLPGGKSPSKPLKPLLNVAGPQPGIPLGENKIVEPIIEPKLSGSALAGLYRQYTGRRVLVTSAAAVAEFNFTQDASPTDPLTYAKAAELLKISATLENFIFVPSDQDPNVDILMLATANRPSQRGIEIFNENDTLPEGDEVIMYVMNLSYIKPAEAVNTFTQIIGQFGSFGSIAAVANAAAVVITENTSLIRKLIQLKKEIDKPSSQVATRFIKVQYADVTELADTLSELLTAQASAQKTAGIQRQDAPAPAPAAAPGAPAVATTHPGGASSSGEETPVQIIPEPRTNRIFAMGRPVDLLFVEGLVREFDVQTSDKTFLRRKLRFLAVSDFLSVASDALTRAFSAGDSAKGGGAAGQAGSKSGSQSGSRSSQSGSNTTSNPRSSSGSSSFGGSSSGFGGSSSGFGGSSSGGIGGSSGGMSSGGSSLNAPQVNSAPESVLVGRTLLVADNITNTIVAQGPPSALEIIERLLDQIDVRPDQIMISAVIGTLTLNDHKAFGVDYLGLSRDFAGRAGAGTGPALPIAPNPGSPAVGTPGTPGYIPAIPAVGAFNPGLLNPNAGLQVYGRVGNLITYVNALQDRSDFTVLSKPQVFGSNNQKLAISSGQRIAIPTGSNTYGAGVTGTGSTQIQYQDVVLKLEVIPLVNSANEITMQIALGDDQVDGTQTIQGAGPNGGNLTVPLISTREVLTTATVANNDTVVLGGLIVGTNTHTKTGIPILCDIPFIGKLFATNDDVKNRSELLIMLQPSIVKDATSLNSTQERINNGYKAYPSARKFSDNGEMPSIDKLPRFEQPPKPAAPPAAPPPTAAPPAPESKAKAGLKSKSIVTPSIHPSSVH